MEQLRMIFEADNTELPVLSVAEGFRLRTISEGDLEKYSALRVSVDFSAWTQEDYRNYQQSVLPEGLFLIEEISSGKFAASAGAERSAQTDTGVLGWVIAHPDFRGKQLGRAVCVAAMQRLYQEGYRKFLLSTDDFRIPAIKTYLKMGWKPLLYQDDMEPRWRSIADKVECSFESFQALSSK